MSISHASDDEKNKWWLLRTGQPPVKTADIAHRFNRSKVTVRKYLTERAGLENQPLPPTRDGMSLRTALSGKFHGDVLFCARR